MLSHLTQGGLLMFSTGQMLLCQLSPISVDERIHDSGSNWQTKEQITTNSLRLLRQVFLVTRHRALSPEPELLYLHKCHKESHM